MKKKKLAIKGEKIPALDRMRELYSVVTTYLLYQYFNAESQPVFGWNYQTVSVCTLLVGRYFFNDNVNIVPYFRHVEAPGSISVFISATTGYNICCGLFLTACMYAIILLVQIMRNSDIRPSKWDPTHPKVH